MLALAVVLIAAHGAWFYKPLKDDDVLAYAKRLKLDEVYVSTAALPLDDPQTPARIARLKSAGLRVDALTDTPSIEAEVTKIAAFNAKQPKGSRFDGVHYDHEPWINSGESNAWAALLLDKYKAASVACEANGLSFTADISGPKFVHLPAEQRSALGKAATRLVLMEYQAPLERVDRHTKEALEVQGARFVVALRAKDLGCDSERALGQLDKQHGAHARYGGWALFGSLDACR